MKKQFLLIFTLLLVGFCVVDSFAAISPTSVPTLIVNKKLEPVSFHTSLRKVSGAYYYWGIKTGSGIAPYNTLPEGLTLNQLGVLSGVPKLAGTFSFTVHLYKKDSTSFDSCPLTVQVIKANPPVISEPLSLSLANGTMDVSYVQNFRANEGIRFQPTPDKPTGYNWSLSWGKIPTGMTFNTVGALSGIPVLDRKLSGNFTQPQTFTFNITATDAVLGNDTKTFTLTINPPAKPEILTDCPLPDGLELQPYANVYLKATSGKKEYKWSVGNSTNPVPLNAFNGFPDGLILSSAVLYTGRQNCPGFLYFASKSPTPTV